MSDCPQCGFSSRECTCPPLEKGRECCIASPHHSFFNCDCEICRPPKKLLKHADKAAD